MKSVCAVLVLLCAGRLVAGAGSLDRLSGSHAAQMTAIGETEAESTARVISEYVRQCETMLAQVKQRGELEKVLHLQAEIERARLHPWMPAEDAARPKGMGPLRVAQEKTRAKLAELHALAGEERSKQLESYAQALKVLEVQYVRSGRLDEAKQARDAANSVAAGERVKGRWFWVDRFRRTLLLSGTVEEDGRGPIGTWSYLEGDPDERPVFRITVRDVDGKTYVDTLTLVSSDRLQGRNARNSVVHAERLD